MRNNNKGKYNIWKFSILNTKKMLNKSYAETLLETQLKFASVSNHHNAAAIKNHEADL